MQHNTYAIDPNPTEGTPSKNANPSKHGIIAIFARVFSMLSKRKYEQIRTSIALFSTVVDKNSPRF